MKHVAETPSRDAAETSPAGLSTSECRKTTPLIRPPRDADVPPLAEIARRAYRASFAAILDAAALERADEAFFAERFARRQERMLLADLDGRPAGFALIEEETLAMLFVEPALGGGGVGSALLRAAEGRGARRLETFAANGPARRFYEQRGWTLSLLYHRPFLGRRHAFAGYVKGPADAVRASA